MSFCRQNPRWTIAVEPQWSFARVPAVVGNASELTQVFVHLLLNAAQAIPEGDVDGNEIRVSTQVVAGKLGAELVVEISDSGIGISPESMARIFNAFEQGERSRTRVFGGLG
jgi:signal transduction histidine kinase